MGGGHHRLRLHRHSAAGNIYHITACTVMRARYFVGQTAFAAAPCFADPRVLGASQMLAWVLMPDHAHWMVQLGTGDTLPQCVTRLKCASARAANRKLRRQGQLWEHAYHDHCLRTDQSLLNVARYIRMNPVRAGLVIHPRFYPFWDSIWL